MFDYRARIYDTRIGRFVEVDQLMQQFKPYLYSANNPIRFIDKSGLYFESAREEFKTGSRPAKVIGWLASAAVCSRGKSISTCLNEFKNNLRSMVVSDIRTEINVYRGKISTWCLRRSTMNKMPDFMESTAINSSDLFIATAYLAWSGSALYILLPRYTLSYQMISAYVNTILSFRDWWVSLICPWIIYNVGEQSFTFLIDLDDYFFNIASFVGKQKISCSLFKNDSIHEFYLIFLLYYILFGFSTKFSKRK